MPNKKSLFSTYLTRSISIACLFLLLTGATLLYLDQRHSLENIDYAREQLIKARKIELKTRTDEAVDFLQYMQSTTEDRLRHDVKERVNQIHSLCMQLFNRALTREEAIRDIKNILTESRFHEGLGYYYAVDLGSTLRVHPHRPDLIGTNTWNHQDSRGNYFARDHIRTAVEHGEGFTDYWWSKPDTPDQEFHKIGYVKLFKPLSWVIGSGLYVDEMTNRLQQEALQVLENRTYTDKGYLFAGTFEGISLLGPAKGRDMWGLTDANGVHIVQELVKAAKNGGGFVTYELPSFDNSPTFTKISYSKAVGEWGWYIGSGFDVSTIEEQVLVMEQEVKARRDNILALLGGMLTAFMLTAAYVMHRFGHGMRRDFRTFIKFFEQAAEQAQPIDREAIQFQEFDALAHAANTMIEERSQAQTALRQSEENYRSIFENIMDGFYRVDLEGNVLLGNPSAARIMGYDDPDEFLGLNLAHDFYKTPEERAKFQELIMRDGRVDGFTADVLRKDGKVIRLESNSRLIRDPQTNEPIGVEGMFRDITERQRTQEFLIQSEKMFSVGGLAAGMAHEINNPLGGILQGVQNVLRRMSPGTKPNEKAAQETGIDLEALQVYMEKRNIPNMLDGIRTSGERAADIVQNMLNFSRKSESRRVDCDIHALIEQALGLASSDYDLKKKYDFRTVDIVREFDSTIGTVPCTENEIVQVLLNLLKNAAQAMHTADTENPRITMRTRRDRETAVIEVEDNGPGMDEATRRRVFEPFFTTKPPGSGTGLGLSVSFFIITGNHHGAFEVYSTPGQGTRFVIRLPLDRPAS